MTTRDLNFGNLTLCAGSGSRGRELCLLEAAAWLAGESHSDHPQCVSVMLGVFGRHLNDVLPDDKRQLLKPCIPRLLATAGDGRDETRRYMALDWLIRTWTPQWFDLAGRTEEATALRAMRRIADPIDALAAGPVVRDVRGRADAARAAAWDEARRAAKAAAWDEAVAAVSAAARDAAGKAVAASAAAGDAARDAANAAAGDAASAAAGKADAARAAASAAAGDAARAGAGKAEAARTAARKAAAAWEAARAAARAAAGDAAQDAVSTAAGDAARAAAWDEAGEMAWDAAGDAARDAARDAAIAAAWDAAGDAAWDAAWDAARDAARAKLAPTVAELQDSAIALYGDLISTGT